MYGLMHNKNVAEYRSPKAVGVFQGLPINVLPLRAHRAKKNQKKRGGSLKYDRVSGCRNNKP
jgi:hypothetical protein